MDLVHILLYSGIIATIVAGCAGEYQMRKDRKEHERQSNHTSTTPL